jgi:polyisoprenoid-binding protein YceI
VRRLAFLTLLFFSTCVTAGETDYRIDPLASQATFEVRVLWVEHVDGEFTQIAGDVVPGPTPESWVVDATISVDSVSMPTSRMRRWVMAPAFFDANHHPLIHFVSNPISQADLDKGGTLTGYLTMRGVTAPIQFAVDPVHCEEALPNPCKIMLHGNLQRSVFGMTTDRLALSDSVVLNLSITLQRESR